MTPALRVVMSALRSDRAVIGIQLAAGALVALFVLISRPREGDPNVFLGIANRVANGEIPYRDFALEYPPLALLPLALPRFAAGGDGYQNAFSLVGIALTIGTAVTVAALARSGFSATRAWLAVGAFVAFVLAAWPSVIWRFDILPALMTALALLAVARGQPAWAGFALAMGAGVKLYPAFLLPVLLACYAFEGRWRSAAFALLGFVLPTVALMAEVVLVAGPGALSYVSYQGERGIEVGSVVGGLALLADALGGPQTRIALGFGAWQVRSPVVDALAVPGFLFQVAAALALLVSGVLAARADVRAFGRVVPRTLVVYSLATLLLVMLANKVLSNQYICWLLPFGALLAVRQSALLLVICALTTFVYPIAFAGLIDVDPLAVAALNVRNVLLLILFVWLVVSESRYVRDPADQPGRDAERQ